MRKTKNKTQAQARQPQNPQDMLKLVFELSQRELEMVAQTMENYPLGEQHDPDFKTAAYKLRRMADAQQTVQIERPVQSHGSSSETSSPANRETPAQEKTGANARQVGGAHYKATRIEHWDFAAANEMDYFQGQITKYVTRWKLKKGVEDLQKAMHFLEKYLELIKQGVITQGGNKE